MTATDRGMLNYVYNIWDGSFVLFFCPINIVVTINNLIYLIFWGGEGGWVVYAYYHFRFFIILPQSVN